MTDTADTRKDLGRRGEDLAAAYLLKAGYRVLARNWRAKVGEKPLPRGEIDIVAQDGRWLVFVEVRTRRRSPAAFQPTLGTPEESVTPAKQLRLIAMAGVYLHELRMAGQGPAPTGPWRIDVIAIELSPAGAVLRLNHLQDAVSGRPS